MENNIIEEPKLIKLGCYNATPHAGLVLSLPSKTFHEIDIDTIYFDDGIRIIEPQQGNIQDLLKLSNGAKNIYLLIFNTIKRAIHINLPDSLNPYKDIRDWKRANNLYNYEGEYNRASKSGNNPITITKPTYKEINISYAINLLENTFETEDKIYRITCQDTKPKRDILMDYQKDYIAWLNQCYIKYGCTYQG
ncbi:hypothetical protein PAM_554 [Onion yellows phytoplasma OY-M]|uniref:Uncharacterized protein n=1 Tax=Onion yellows phytoplasma (strain OY-M) TaxID=262768 RepID=Q6YQ21_ONYPE|nr:hypothetical protein PAM_554 [Onion yellows phytoplasma OY-M]